MKKQSIIYLIVLILVFFSQSLCYEYNITKVSDWKSFNATSEDYKIAVSPVVAQSNSLTLQLPDSKIVALVHGIKSKGSSQLIQQIAILDFEGSVLYSAINENVSGRSSAALSLTNVENEFIYVYTENAQIYFTFYDEKLNYKRGAQNKKLTTVGTYSQFYYPIISMGKDIMYITLMAQNQQSQCIQVYVLDLSDTSTYTISKTHSYTGYYNIKPFGYTIQAYNDNSAIAHFYAVNNQNQDILVQLQYKTPGILRQNYPKEIKKTIPVETQYANWNWNSVLHQDNETSTFITSNNSDQELMLYTFGKDGDEICYEIIDISGYYGFNYYYGIHGNKGWIYLQDTTNQQGYFALFDPEICTLNLKKMTGTSIYQGSAGSFVDFQGEKILVFEYGNLVDVGKQKNVQGKIYRAGFLEVDEDVWARLLGFQVFVGFLLVFSLVFW
ncbi:hypothetical protein PPERSA_09085 [Pseudocohnilembus persalinus]|uniref:Transmembrane protein n=1 Tax=Pseudocohnilembus persalinus TaxID=266149 RepID=A0A0V0Q7J0_PSEPJ|nr:hypothetical protein PPERSA_09085 [Pseudocohnilembus persalinus]|eukprot:KRW98145.1 hypothetical protein PPERSA_09085 [Pseudocohnilembus persalinus]